MDDDALTPTASGALRIAHLCTVDMSLELLLGTELSVDVEGGHTVFGISAPGRYVGQVEARGVTHVPVTSLTRSWSPGSDLRAFAHLLSTLRALDLDVLHTHNPKTGVMGRIAGRLAGVPVVVNTCHGLWAGPGDPPLRRAFVYGLEALASRFSDFELFQNADDRATLRPALRRGRHRVVGNGVDLERFAPDPEGRRRVRAELGVAEDEVLVGVVGRRVPEKGLAEFGHVAEALAGRATFVWVGPEDDVETGGLVSADAAVRFVGERADMPAVYSALDVFVLPSHREGFSRASMEAAACGTAMVLTDIRGCREIGDHGKHLLLVPPGDPQALAAAVNDLVRDERLRDRLGGAARTRAMKAFDQREVARVSLETYAAVARRRARRRRPDRAPTTVLHVLPADLDRGAQVFAGRLRDALADDEDSRHLVVTLFRADDAALRADVRLDVPSGPLRGIGLDPRAVARLRRAIRDLGADVVVAHGGEPLKYVVPAAGRTPVVYKRIGLSSAELSRPSRRFLYRRLAPRAARVVCVSQAILEQSRTTLGLPERSLVLIPNGRDPDVYHPPARDDQRADPPLVLFVGRLEEGKRPELFLRVVDEVRRRGVQFTAQVAGDGPLRDVLGPRARALDVQLLGVRTDVPELLREAAVLVMTSAGDTEGMPGVLVEAGLSGTPVVSTQAAGVPDVVVDGGTGFIASDLVADLADRLEALLTDPELRSTMGARARQHCVQSFTIAASADSWRTLTNDIARRPRQGGGPWWPTRSGPHRVGRPSRSR